jgi:cell division protein FtsL
MTPIAAPARSVRPAPRSAPTRTRDVGPAPAGAYATRGSALLAPERGTPATRPARRTDHLHVVGPRERARRRLTPAVGVVLTIGLFAVLLALAVAHTVLVQGQMRLDDIDARLATEQARYQDLRKTVAELESPVRVVAAAHDQGMVSPADLVYLQPTSPDQATAPTNGSTDAGAVAGPGGSGPARDTSGSWSTMKPLLEGAGP